MGTLHCLHFLYKAQFSPRFLTANDHVTRYAVFIDTDTRPTRRQLSLDGTVSLMAQRLAALPPKARKYPHYGWQHWLIEHASEYRLRFKKIEDVPKFHR